MRQSTHSNSSQREISLRQQMQADARVIARNVKRNEAAVRADQFHYDALDGKHYGKPSLHVFIDPVSILIGRRS
jgi:hypothetical protein